VACACAAFEALANSLYPPHAKHQALLGVELHGLLPAAAFCVARSGPQSMVMGSLLLLERVVKGNKDVAQCFNDAVIKMTPHVSGKTHPPAYEQATTLSFGYNQDLHGQLLRCVTVPNLLAERYIYPQPLWAASADAAGEGGELQTLKTRCLRVLGTSLQGDLARASPSTN